MKVIDHYSPRGCANGMCPGIIVTDRKTIVIVGNVLSEDEKARLNMTRNEDAVEVPCATFEDLLNQYLLE
jgi:hypothetical protein